MIKKQSKKLIAWSGLAMAGLATAASGACFADTEYESHTDVVNVSVSELCTITRTAGSGNYAVTMSSGTVRSNIGSSTLSISCNDANGWRLMAKGWNNDLGVESTDLTSADGNSTIPTGTATSGANSAWAMKLGTGSTGVNFDNGFANNTFHEIPGSDTRVVYGNTAAAGVSLTTTYQVYINSSQPAGVYKGGVKYTLEHPAEESICGAIMPMQGITDSYISSMTPEAQVQMCDERDGKTYWVAKLADGNVWMTQNLDFDIDESVEYTHRDTDLGWGENYDEDATWTPDLSTYTDSSWDRSSTTPESYDPGELCWTGELNVGTSLDYAAESCTPEEIENHYQIGNYYNWTAAVAMNDSSEWDDGGDDTDQSICPAGWMLPKSGDQTGDGSFYKLVNQYGWNSSSYNMEGDYSMWDAPLSFVLGGLWNGDSGDVGSRGYYWSSVVSDSFDAFYFSFGSDGYVYPQYVYIRNYGYSVRCVAR